MYSANFILGRLEREEILSKEDLRPVAYWEANISSQPKLTTFYANTQIFSFYTERDEMQAVGKLYKGIVDD